MDDFNRNESERSTYAHSKPAEETEVEPPVLEPQSREEMTEPIAEPQVVVRPAAKKTYQEYLEAADDCISRKDYRRAEIEYGRAQKALAKNDRRRVYTYEQLGAVALKSKATARAKNYYIAAIQTAKNLRISDVNVVNAYLGLAYCFEKSGNTALAIRNYEKALDLSASSTTKSRIRKLLQRLKARI